MQCIGIDESNHSLVFEGNSTSSHAVWPAPTLSVASILRAPIDTSQLPQNSYLNGANLVFREDSFDPITRVRRGRIYKASNRRPEDWYVQPHPAYYNDVQVAQRNGGRIPKRMLAFDGLRVLQVLGEPSTSALIALGTAEAYTLWRIVDIERIITGEDLLTLKARNSLGVLPELNLNLIPQKGRKKLLELVERLGNLAYRAGPEDVIESSRAVTQWSLALYLADRDNNPNLLEYDLGQLKNLLKERQLLESIVPIMAKLHSRAKPNEQVRYDTRPLLEADAEYALASIGMILRELGWTI